MGGLYGKITPRLFVKILFIKRDYILHFDKIISWRGNSLQAERFYGWRYHFFRFSPLSYPSLNKSFRTTLNVTVTTPSTLMRVTAIFRNRYNLKVWH